jgi:hypothetical protein
MDDIDPKLLKIVALAKRGVGGEKTAAIALVKKICLRENLDFDEIMSDTEAVRQYEPDIKFVGKDELQIAIQVAARFATTKEHPKVVGNWYYGVKLMWLRYTTTPQKHIDTLNAIRIYLKAYRREKKNILRSLPTAFYSHHGLYSSYTKLSEEPPKPKTDQERLDDWRAANMSQAMTEQVNLVKEIGEGQQ